MTARRPDSNPASGALRPATGWCSLLAVCLLFAGIGLSQVPAQTPREEAGGQPSAAQIARWIQQLDDDAFEVRTTATQRLIAAGADAVEPLAAQLGGANLEVTMRTVFVLREMAISADVAAQQRSVEALEAIVKSTSRSAARMASEALSVLAEMRQKQTIQQLAELGAEISGYGQTAFAAPGAIWSLDVQIGAGWKGELQDLQRLKWLTDLSRIAFVGPQVTDEWIESIRDMQSLNIVVIQDAQITDRSMEVISGLKAVVSLDLMYAPVTDRGFALLKRMPSLRQVRCFGTQVTPAAAERFRVEFANVDVQHKMGAFLGVRCVQPPFACAVSSVTSQSAAEKAGIRSNDIIVEFDKQPVRDFEDLQQLIGVRKVGDTVEIRVARCEADPVELGVAQQSLEDLGVELQSNNIGLLVQQVQAGKGAMRAGLKVGDVIATLDDVRLTDVDQWQKLFQQPPGNPLPEAGFRRLEILRGIKYIKLKVVFGAWDTGL